MSDEIKNSQLSTEGHILKHKPPSKSNGNKNPTTPTTPNKDGKPQPNDKSKDKPQQ